MVRSMTVQVDLVVELRVLHIDSEATGSPMIHWMVFAEQETSEPTFTVTYFLQQGHTHSNNTIPVNSSTASELMGPKSFKLPQVLNETICLLPSLFLLFCLLKFYIRLAILCFNLSCTFTSRFSVR